MPSISIRVAAVLSVALLLSAAAPPAPAQADPAASLGVTTVEVFANSAMLITPTRSDRYRLVIHRVDQLEQVRQAINQQIPKGGEAVAREWFAANGERIKRQIRPAAIAAANAISLANHYRIDRLPAVVINRQAVVYGMTDVDAALRRFQAARGGGS